MRANARGAETQIKSYLADYLRQCKAAVSAHPFVVAGLALIMVGLASADLGEVIPLFAPVVALAYFPFFHDIHDLLALGLALYVAYRWLPGLGAGAILLFLAVHVPYFYLEFPEELPESSRMVFTTLVVLIGVYVIDRQRRAEELFRTLSHSSPVGIYLVQEGKFRFVNPQFQRYTGYSEEELLGTDSLRFVHPEDRKMVREIVVKMLKGERASPYEYLTVNKSGESRWALVKATSILYGGRPAVLGTYMDITEQKQAEAEIEEHTQRLEALHQVGQAASQSLDPETVAALALEAALKVLGLDAGIIRYLDEGTQELMPLSQRGLPPELAREVHARPGLKIGQGLAGTVSQSGEPLIVEDLPQAPRPTYYGAARHAGFQSYVGLPLKVKDSIVGVMSGFSRHRRTFTPADVEMLADLGNMVGMAIANARLFEQVEAKGREWERTFDTMGDGVAIISPDFRILRANLALARTLGTTPEALVGQHCYEAIHGLVGPLPECPAHRCLTEKRACDLVRQEPHLGNRWLHLHADPVLGPQGEVLSVVHTVRDITQEKQRQESLERLYQLSQVLSTSLDLDTVLGLAVEEVGRISGLASATTGIALLDEWGQQLTVVAARGWQQETVKSISLPLSLLSEAVVQLLFRERLPWLVTDTSQVAQAIKGLPGYKEHRAFVVLPLVVADRTIGVLFIASTEPWAPGPGELALLETCTREVALAVENARLYTRTDAALRRRVNEMEALTGVLTAATRGLQLETGLNDALERATDALEVERASLILFDESGEQGTVRLVYQRGRDFPPGLGLTLEVAAFPTLQKVRQERQPVVIEDTRALPEGTERDFLRQVGIRSSVVVPLMVGDRAIGTINFGTVTGPKGYPPQMVALAQAIAGHLASVIENARLHEATERERGTLESIMASMSEGLVVTDAQGRVAYCNRAAEELLGLNAAQFLGQPVGVFNNLLSTRIVAPKEWRRALAMRFEEAAGQPEFHFEVQLAERREIEATLFIIGSSDKRLGTGAVLRDVTREREVDRMKTEFVSISSHELRTPMTAVYGFAELLLKARVGTPEQQEWVTHIYRESQRLISILDDLLNVSRIETGRLSLKLGAVALEPLISEIISQLRPRFPAHSFRLDIPHGFPAIQADAEKLTQVLYNLVDNAAKYSPQGGGVQVSVRRDEETDQAVIAVADQGLGIPASEMPRLFTRFHHIQRPEAVGIRGTGLGLYIVKSLTEMMGGRIWAESQVNEGSTFYVALPLVEAALNLNP